MSQRTKSRRSNGLMLMLYQRPLHPELFNILADVKVDRRNYSADVWLVEGGHVLSFTVTEAGAAQAGVPAGTTLTEVVQMNGEPMSEQGLTESLLCRGERYHELDVEPNLRYMVSTQEEQLSATLFEATKTEIMDYAAKRELIVGDTPADPVAGRGGITSVLDVERRANELHVHSFHLFEDGYTVVKTQAFMEVLKKRVVAEK
ncbi:MAG: DUF2617 family protein [Planctomycetota bacterium]